MMQNHDYELEALRREHLMQQSQKRQRIEQLRAEQAKPTTNRGIVNPTLASMGRVLSNIGDNLQQRYGDLPTSTTNTALQTETA